MITKLLLIQRGGAGRRLARGRRIGTEEAEIGGAGEGQHVDQQFELQVGHGGRTDEFEKIGPAIRGQAHETGKQMRIYWTQTEIPHGIDWLNGNLKLTV